ncbi:MAG: sulfotransferase [Novosphingobium sp.]
MDLRLVGSNEPGKKWLLKNPGHVENLDQLFATFPNARVIHTHRDPAKAIPSLCALLIGNHALFEEGRREERAWQMGLRETEKWARGLRRAEPVRQAHAGQVLDVVHTQFHRDPMGTVERIYSFAGLELSDAVRGLMAQRIADKPELAHGAHSYSLSDFGLTAESVRERFGDYVQRFDLVEMSA